MLCEPSIVINKEKSSVTFIEKVAGDFFVYNEIVEFWVSVGCVEIKISYIVFVVNEPYHKGRERG